MKKVYPEMRGSHLAAQLEREKALKTLKRHLEAKKMANQKEATVVTMKGEPMTQQTSQEQPRKRRRILRPGQRLSPQLVDTILGAIDRDVGAVCEDLGALDPNRSHGSRMGLLNDLKRDRDHKWSSTSLNLLTRLAARIRGELPFVVTPAERAPVRHAAQVAITPTQSDTSPAIDKLTMLAENMTTMMNTMGRLLEVTIGQREQPQRIALPRPTSEMSQQALRRILYQLHGAWADRCMAEQPGLDRKRSFAIAWQLSYDAYTRETGRDVQSMARAESKTAGRKIEPLDIIERDGDMALFLEIAKKTWEA